MKNKLLIILAALFVFTANIYAEDKVEGTYTGDLKITVDPVIVEIADDFRDIPVVRNAEVTLTKVDEKYTMVFPFNVAGFPFDFKGNITVTGVNAEIRPVIYLQQPELVAGPKIHLTGDLEEYQEFAGGEYLELYYRLGNSQIDANGKLTAKVEAIITVQGVELKLVIVEFGDFPATGIETYTDNSLSIYTSPASDVITVIGSVNENYSIYNVNGSLIQAGNMQNGQIGISNIASGVYFVKVDNKTAKFIK